MSALLGVFILGILSGWLMEWIFVRLFVPNPKKKVELALQASRKEVENLQKQNRELQASLKAVAVPAVAPVAVEAEPIVEVEVPVAEAVVEELESVAETLEAEAPAVEAAKDDDLTRLGGIGPKLAEAMNAAGITTYAQIAAMSSDELSKSLSESGVRYNKTAAETWAAQAKLAAEGDWKGLKDFQAQNKGA
ncbi:MAG: helix-hairpin-helix domain-containing protein [Thiothrix sp.]|uniref:helix-hairpin-helix domain-containing protein n=1 Tax=Thiothrix sp. TaxID=1032 RepID=UPI0026170078|nr:helix-hairpin-helix domain-containing protein [Thiothrix sp.]MDD5392709.1 helix-hairpin-helix domain-containing protein [Thiothrix sp.]